MHAVSHLQIQQVRAAFHLACAYTAWAGYSTRIPFGHPEGFIEAFANVYLGVAEAIADEVSGVYPRADGYDFPDVEDGVQGMAFIEAAVKSSKNNAAWTGLGR